LFLTDILFSRLSYNSLGQKDLRHDLGLNFDHKTCPMFDFMLDL